MTIYSGFAAALASSCSSGRASPSYLAKPATRGRVMRGNEGRGAGLDDCRIGRRAFSFNATSACFTELLQAIVPSRLMPEILVPLLRGRAPCPERYFQRPGSCRPPPTNMRETTAVVRDPRGNVRSDASGIEKRTGNKPFTPVISTGLPVRPTLAESCRSASRRGC